MTKDTKKTIADETNEPIKKVRAFNFDFVGNRKKFFIISAILCIASVLVSFIGLKVAIEFKGGTIVSVEYSGEINADDFEQFFLERYDTDSVRVQVGDSFNSDRKVLTISLSGQYVGEKTAENADVPNGENSDADGESSDGETASAAGSQLKTLLTEKFPDNDIELLSSSNVDPSSGQTFFNKSITAVIFAALLLIIYISLSFKAISGWYAGLCGIAGILHNVLITYGFFVALRFEIDTNFIAVVLTILGFSINDTIVVYDRIRENRKLHKKMGVYELVNLSVNQSVTRALRTSVAAIATMIIVSIVCPIMGVTSILSLSVPLAIGLTVGTYSSLCIAPTLWTLREEKSPKAAAKA